MQNILNHFALKVSVIKAILDNEDVMTIIEKSDDTRWFWIVNAIYNSPSTAKLITASVNISWDDIVYALHIIHIGRQNNIIYDDEYKATLLSYVHFESLYYLLNTIDPATITPDTNNMLFRFIKILADASPPKAKNLVRFVIDNRLYDSADDASDLAKTVGLKF